MDKLKNILSPGHKEDDAKMYGTTNPGQASSAAQNFTSDVARDAKTTPGSSHPRAADDPSAVAEHMPGAFANTPREEFSSTAGGLGGTSTAGSGLAGAATTRGFAPQTSSTTGYSTTQAPHASTAAPASAAAASAAHPAHVGTSAPGGTSYSTTNPPHSSVAAPASAALASGTHPTHSSVAGTGYSTTHPPHASTAAPASAAAASNTVPAHTSGASDNGSVASIKSGITGGPHATAAADPHGRGSTAVHTTRETIGTAEGTSTVKTTTTTALAPDGTPLHSQTHRERDNSAIPPATLASGTSSTRGHGTSHAPGTTGVATVPAGTAAGISSGSPSTHEHNPSFSNRTLGHNQYGSLDPASGISGGTNLNTVGRDATTGLSGGAIQESQHHRVHGPHQDTHPNQPGAAVGVTNQPAISGSLPDRSRAVNEPGTRAAVGETSTYSSFPVGGHHIDGPHQTATANILDPKVDSTTGTTSAHGHSSGSASGTSTTGHTARDVSGSSTTHTREDPASGVYGTSATRTAPGVDGTGSHGHHGTSTAVGAGAAATGAGAYGAHELGQKSHAGPGQALTTEGTLRRDAPVTQQRPVEAAAEKTITGDQTHHHRPAQSTTTTTHQTAGTTSEHDPSKQHHTGREAAAVGAGAGAGAGLAGAASGGVPYAGTSEGRDQPLGASVDKGPASSTIGPHKSNILNILDPRVKPDAAVQGSEKSSKLDSRVEGPAAGAGATSGATAGTAGHHAGTTSQTPHQQRTSEHSSTQPVGTATHGTAQQQREIQHTTASDPQQLSRDDVKRSDVTDSAASDVAHEHDSGRHGLSSLLHRDNPNKLHKDPPSK